MVAEVPLVFDTIREELLPSPNASGDDRGKELFPSPLNLVNALDLINLGRQSPSRGKVLNQTQYALTTATNTLEVRLGEGGKNVRHLVRCVLSFIG